MNGGGGRLQPREVSDSGVVAWEILRYLAKVVKDGMRGSKETWVAVVPGHPK